MKYRRLTFLFCWAFLWTSLSAGAEDWSSLIAPVLKLQREYQIPAVGLIIMDDGEPVMVEAFGTATRETPFRWGSISKSFTALGALHLLHERGIDVNTRASALLPEGYYHNPWSSTHPVRVVDLLQLSAGLPDLSPQEFQDNRPLSLVDALLRNGPARIVQWPPGWQHSYSNVAPGLTAALIESISGKSFETYMDDAVFHPMGMPGASFLPVRGLPGGYQSDGTTEIAYWHMTFRAFGALNASVKEMANFLRVLLNEGRSRQGRAFDAQTIALMRTPSATLGARAGLSLTYASGIYPWVRSQRVFWGHGGDADGYRSRYGLLLDAKRGYLLVINTDNPQALRRMQREVEQRLIRDLPKADMPADFPIGNLGRYTGEYYPSGARFGLDQWKKGAAPKARVAIANGRLAFTRNGRTTILYPMAEGQFRRVDDPQVSVVFTATNEGVMLLQGELGNFFNMSQGECPAFLELCARE